MALLLTRKAGESIVMDGGIEITVAEVSGKYVRLAIDAPDHVQIYRPDALRQAPRNHAAVRHAITAPARPSEEDMISRPRLYARAASLASLAAENDQLREELALLKRNEEHVE